MGRILTVRLLDLGSTPPGSTPIKRLSRIYQEVEGSDYFCHGYILIGTVGENDVGVVHL